MWFFISAIINFVSNRPRGGVLERESGIPNSKCLDPWGFCFFLNHHTNFRSIREFNCLNSTRNVWQPWVLFIRYYQFSFWVHVGLQFFAPLKLSVITWAAVISEMLSGGDACHFRMETLSVDSLFTNLPVLESGCPVSLDAGRGPAWKSNSQELRLRNKPLLF